MQDEKKDIIDLSSSLCLSNCYSGAEQQHHNHHHHNRHSHYGSEIVNFFMGLRGIKI